VKKLVFKIGEQEIYICVYACVVGLCRIGLLSGVVLAAVHQLSVLNLYHKLFFI
jgi:hypothetical protein